MKAPAETAPISSLAFELAIEHVDSLLADTKAVRVLLARAMAKGVTVTDIARTTGFDRSGVLKWARGAKRPCHATRVRLLAWGIESGLVSILGDQPPLDPLEIAVLARIRLDLDPDSAPPAVADLLAGVEVGALQLVAIERWATAPAPLGAA